MPIKPPITGKTTASVHRPSVSDPVTRPARLPLFDGGVAPPHPERILSTTTRTSTDPAHGVIAPAPPRISISSTANPAPAPAPLERPLKDYWITTLAVLPAPDAQGISLFKGRQYVEVPDGGTVQIERDPASGRYRAKLPSELNPSGPVLQPDSDSLLWRPVDRVAPVTLRLSTKRLEAFRTDLDFSTADPDGDGLYRFEGKLYAWIEQRAYQVLLDLDASTPEHSVWRIVKTSDPVAIDSDNHYRAHRSGATVAITRNKDNNWAGVSPGLVGGMPRQQPSIEAKVAEVQSAQLINALRKLEESAAAYERLREAAMGESADSPKRYEALVSLEVSLRKHMIMHEHAIELFKRPPASPRSSKEHDTFEQNLKKFRLEQIEHLNKLMVIMDMRYKGAITGRDAESCRKIIVYLDKKLKIALERQAIMSSIQQDHPGSTQILKELRKTQPVKRIIFKKLLLFVHLYAGAPGHSPNLTMPSLASLDLITGDLKKVPRSQQPMALMLTLDQLQVEKSRFEQQLSANHPSSEYIREILPLIDDLEHRIERRLTKILDSVGTDRELPSLDQDIDFDFIPPQPSDSAASASPRKRKIFSTRQHGVRRVLAGETETAQDGKVILKVTDALRPDSPPQIYEKKKGEWLLASVPAAERKRATPTPRLLEEANRLLTEVTDEAAGVMAPEANPSEMQDNLARLTDRLQQQRRLLEQHLDVDENSEIRKVIERLRTTAKSLSEQGKTLVVQMYKNKDVLNVMRLNYLLDHNELKVSKITHRQQMHEDKTFLDVYLIKDRTANEALWEAHFHYDREDSLPLSFNRLGYLKTLKQSRSGIKSQRLDARAGVPHVRIWRETFDGKTATRLFALASNAASATQ